MTDDEEHDLWIAYTECVKRLRSGDRIARLETIQNGVGVSAVITVVGRGITFRVINAIDKLMDKAERQPA